LEEIDKAFSSTNPKHTRAILFDGLRDFVKLIQFVGWVKLVFVDGSFVTDKESPGDIDVTIELPAASPEVAATFLKSSIFNRDQIKQKYGVDVLPTTEHQDLRDFFQSLKTSEARKRGLQPNAVKGILRLKL